MFPVARRYTENQVREANLQQPSGNLLYWRHTNNRLLQRSQVLVAGAILGADGHKQVLRLGLRGLWRERFAALLKRISELARSTMAQFTCCEENPNDQALGTTPALPQTRATRMGQLRFLG